MISWLEKYKRQSEEALKSGLVRQIEFSGPTYQIEVFDPEERASFWPFFQFDEKGQIQDAFCSCPAGENGCWHLAAAFSKIFGEKKKLLHVRFQRSFWNRLCQLFAEHTGYEAKQLEKKNEDLYVFENAVRFEISGQNLKDLLEKKQKDTPENSLRFSNFSQEEIVFWREGRPSKELRYALSFWSDLAKKMMFSTDEAHVFFEEDEEGFPTLLTAEFPDFSTKWKLSLEDLESLINSLDTINSSLKLFHLPEERISAISFDPTDRSLKIEHEEEPKFHLKDAKKIGLFAYVSGKGFYFLDGHTLLTRKKIPYENIPAFIDQYKEELIRFIPVSEQPVSLSYEIYFDSDWNWHFLAYLFVKRDLLKASSAFFGRFGYIQDKGFFPLENVLFDKEETIIAPAEVSKFINHHRVFLNGQEGFQTHLSSVESHISFSVTEGGILRFHSKSYKEGRNEKDFGDWIYYENLGFFSKKHAKLGLIIRPGLEVKKAEIARFIKANQEELEAIPNFFTSFLPVRDRFLEVGVASPHAIYIRPVDVVIEHETYRYFGDFVYTEGKGFCELPLHMRLPEDYAQEKHISQHALSSFFSEELPFLMKFVRKIDPRLNLPHKTEYEVHYLVRMPKGGLKTDLILTSENGKISIADLFEAFEKKRKFVFSDAGLIDLQDPKYNWIKHLHAPNADSKMFELTAWEFLRLDATVPLLTPDVTVPHAEITQQLIRELREFSSHDKPNLMGLKSELRLYQQTGLNWLWFLYKNGLSGVLCDDMGLGKTHQAMGLIASILNQKDTEKKCFLVVCPTSVIYHWQDKLATFLPKIKVQTFHGQKRSLKGFSEEGIILTTYGILRMEKKALGEIPFELAIFDEIQTAKNPRSRIHSALLHLNARMRVGLTGTPIENNLSELKALFDIVLPGYMPSETRFRELFINPIEKGGDEEKRALLSAMIRPFTLRRRKNEVLKELPEKSEDKSYCELSEEQTSLYFKMLSQNKDEIVAQLRDSSVQVNYVHIFALLSHLKQICNHPALIAKDVKNYKHYTSGKWDLFVELLEAARESDQKVVIFSQYLLMLDIIEEYLKEKKWGYAQIRGSTVDRRQQLKQFQEDPHCVVFIGSLQAAGVGIDLTAASVVILFDRWWNAAKENQAIDRVHRIGQKWGVQVYKLITKDTIEEKIDLMISKKGKLLEEVITSDDEAVLKRFTRSDLIELLTFQHDQTEE